MKNVIVSTTSTSGTMTSNLLMTNLSIFLPSRLKGGFRVGTPVGVDPDVFERVLIQEIRRHAANVWLAQAEPGIDVDRYERHILEQEPLALAELLHAGSRIDGGIRLFQHCVVFRIGPS